MVKIVISFYNEWIIKEVVFFFVMLIESEEEVFVENDNFFGSLMNLLVCIIGVNSICFSVEIEVCIVELVFNIMIKICLNFEILFVWFKFYYYGLYDVKYVDGYDKFMGKI